MDRGLPVRGDPPPFSLCDDDRGGSFKSLDSEGSAW